MRKTRIERWKSDKGNREDHYFAGAKGQIYLFGYNPKYVSPQQLKKILKILKI